MKRIQRILAAFLSVITLITLITVPASAVSVNDPSVFLEQQITGSNGTCTLATMAMMLRRRAILNGASDWANITENSIRPNAWTNGQGLNWTVNYAGMTAKMRGLSGPVEQKKNTLISLLNDHPEGIEIYNGNQPHAVLLTDYDASTGKFYCADPAGQTARIQLSSSTLKPKDGDQDAKIAGINKYWYITNGTDSTNSTVPAPNISISSLVSGEWSVTVPANYKLVCYDSANATKSSTYYIAAKTAPYKLSCTQKATLSNGKTRYFFVSGDNKNLWFDYTSGMSVVPSTTTDVASYIVTFNPNGGSISQTTKTVKSGQKYDALPMPSRDGYTFDGWYTFASGGTQVTAATTVNLTGNQTLYAHWTKIPVTTYTVTFDPNGGSVWPATKTLEAGTRLTGMPTPTRNGYIFRGWAMDKIDPDGNGVNVTTIVADGVWTFDKDTTLYAHWAKELSTNPPQNAPQGIVKPTSFDYNGKFGVNNALTWGLNTSAGVLVLSGNGKMQNWSNAENRPWAQLRNTVTGVIIENGIQNLGRYALARCENMTSVSIPESVTEISDGVFMRAYSLASIDLPQNLTAIGSGAFSECTSLRSITIPKNVGFIETGAFSGCSNLESIYFCGNAPSYFGDNGVVRLNMFSGCRNLTVYYPANSSGWAPIIEKYTDVTWRTWNPGSTVSSNPAPTVANTTTWGSWSAWSTAPYSASSTRQVESQQVKVSDAYTEYRYGLWRNTNNASWCPDYGASLSSSGGSWYESYSNWSKTRLYRDTGHNAFCSGGNHNHTHVAGYDSSGQAYWDIYSDDGTFTGWGRLYYYWEETRTIPAVYETQYRYRDLTSG